MITKEDLKKSLRTKYASRGLTETALDKLTEIVFKQLTEETTDEELATAIAGVEDYVSLLQSEVDSVRTKTTKKVEKKTEEGAAGGDNTTETETTEGEEKVPQWAKDLQDEIRTLRTEKISSTRKSQLDKVLEGLTDKQKRPYNRLKLDSYTDEEFTAELEGITTEADDMRKENEKQGVLVTPPRAGGNNPQPKEPPKDQKEAVENQFRW